MRGKQKLIILDKKNEINIAYTICLIVLLHNDFNVNKHFYKVAYTL